MALTSLEEQFLEIIKSMAEVQSQLVWLVNQYRSYQDSHVVLSATETLKHYIELSIQNRVGILNRSDVKKLIGRRSSPKDLGPKISIAYRIGILDDKTYVLAMRIKDVRDIFAHNKNLVMLHVEPALSAFKALHTNPEFSGIYSQVFLNYVRVVGESLK